MHTYRINGVYNNIWSGEYTSNYINEDVKSILNPDYLLTDNQEDIINKINFDEYYSNLGTWGGHVPNNPDLIKYMIKNMILALYSKKQITNLLKSKKEYDYVIIMRPDLEILTKLNINLLTKLTDNNIIIPSMDWHLGGCNDRFCIAKKNIAIYYGTLYNNLLEYSKNKSIISELYLYEMLNKENIKIISSDEIKYNTIRMKV